MPLALPRAPLEVAPVFDDPSLIETLVKRGGPYFTVQRYVKNKEEMISLGSRERVATRAMPIAPWFRGDWAFDERRVEGVEAILHHPRFIESAKSLFGAAIVAPEIVYANLMTPMPRVDPGHIDVPSFRGFDRRERPIWLLMIMQKSGLFERWYVPVATAVAWYYEGEAGGFRFWPEGPDASPRRRPCQSNTALVGDNEHMFHAVERVGASESAILTGLSLDSELRWSDAAARFEVFEGEELLRSYPYEALRLSISWKARVFLDEAAERRALDHEDDLSAPEVLRVFLDDLGARGVEAEPPEDLETDPAFMRVLNDAYAVNPSVFR